MKFNRAALLGITSLLISVAPISLAIAGQAPTQTVTQAASTAIASGAFVAGEVPHQRVWLELSLRADTVT